MPAYHFKSHGTVRLRAVQINGEVCFGTNHDENGRGPDDGEATREVITWVPRYNTIG